MNFRFTHPELLWLLPLSLGWVAWWAWKSDLQVSRWRRGVAVALRMVVAAAVVLAIAGLRWMRPLEGVNVIFLLDRSESVPSPQQEAARKYVNRVATDKKKTDTGGVLVFGSEAAIEFSPNPVVDLQKINAVVGVQRTDIAAAIRLGTAAFPETGQKRLVLLSDGNENLGDALAALTAAQSLGVTLDVVPLKAAWSNDVSVQRLGLPSRVKQGQTFDAKIFINADQAGPATLRIYRNDQPMGEQRVELTAGKNLFTFPQTLPEAGFYGYTVYVEAPGDTLPQNNAVRGFINVQGDPRVLLVSAEPAADRPLVAALESSRVKVRAVGLEGLPNTLAELQSYDAVFISNLAAGDLGHDVMNLLESAVRDFGVGLVCVGGDNTYAAGGYRGTPLENTLPVNMELDSKKVLPSGAVALVMHGMEFMNGNQIARECALGVLDALGPPDEMGVVLWDGTERWLFPMTKVGDRKELGRKIAGMNQGDLPSFGGVMGMAYEGLKNSPAHLKHMIVFSDGDPAPPSPGLMQSIVGDRITVSTVLIAGHFAPDTMIWIAEAGRGKFYHITDPGQLPQIFIKEAAVVLKSAIFEEPFRPRLAAMSEPVRGISAEEFPALKGYVCTTPKPRAEVPLVSDKGDPVLAHWQYGLGRAVAFTSDARARWAVDWLGWGKYRQFWSQVAQWSLRRVAVSDFTTEVAVDRGEGHLIVEAVDEGGNYRNFLTLQAAVLGPKGERQMVRLEQTGPGRYETRFPTKDVGAYVLNLLEVKDGKVVGTQTVGASINYSPEFSAPEPNRALLRCLADTAGGKTFDLAGPAGPSDSPFLHDRRRTYQPRDWWEWLLKLAVVLFVFDVAVRRIHLERDQWQKALAAVRRAVRFWQPIPQPVEAEVSLATLLARRDQVRARTTSDEPAPRPELFQPQREAPLPGLEPAAPAEGVKLAESQPPPIPEPRQPQPSSTTSRLLEAKKRARRKME
jgi:uncharacterized membrane protein